MEDDGIVRVTGHVQHLRLGPEPRKPLGQLAPVHARHYDVRQHQVDRF